MGCGAPGGSRGRGGVRWGAVGCGGSRRTVPRGGNYSSGGKKKVFRNTKKIPVRGKRYHPAGKNLSLVYRASGVRIVEFKAAAHLAEKYSRRVN